MQSILKLLFGHVVWCISLTSSLTRCWGQSHTALRPSFSFPQFLIVSKTMKSPEVDYFWLSGCKNTIATKTFKEKNAHIQYMDLLKCRNVLMTALFTQSQLHCPHIVTAQLCSGSGFTRKMQKEREPRPDMSKVHHQYSLWSAFEL